MNHQFDPPRERVCSFTPSGWPGLLPPGKLTKSMAQFATRCDALKKLGLGLAGQGAISGGTGCFQNATGVVRFSGVAHVDTPPDVSPGTRPWHVCPERMRPMRPELALVPVRFSRFFLL